MFWTTLDHFNWQRYYNLKKVLFHILDFICILARREAIKLNFSQDIFGHTESWEYWYHFWRDLTQWVLDTNKLRNHSRVHIVFLDICELVYYVFILRKFVKNIWIINYCSVFCLKFWDSCQIVHKLMVKSNEFRWHSNTIQYSTSLRKYRVMWLTKLTYIYKCLSVIRNTKKRSKVSAFKGIDVNHRKSISNQWDSKMEWQQKLQWHSINLHKLRKWCSLMYGKWR